MGVASAQHALHDGGVNAEVVNPDRIGIAYGCDYILSHPQEFREGVRASLDENEMNSTILKKWNALILTRFICSKLFANMFASSHFRIITTQVVHNSLIDVQAQFAILYGQ